MGILAKFDDYQRILRDGWVWRLLTPGKASSPWFGSKSGGCACWPLSLWVSLPCLIVGEHVLSLV